MIVKIALLFTMYILPHGENPYWEGLNREEKQIYLESLPSNSFLKKVYYGNFELRDDIQTGNVLDSLMDCSNDRDRMFKFYLLNKIAYSADGALSEMVNQYCFDFFCKYPDFVLCYLKDNADTRNEYLIRIGQELYYRDVSKEEFKNYFREYELSEDSNLLLDNFIMDLNVE